MTEFTLWILITVSSTGAFAPTSLHEFKNRAACESLQRQYEAASGSNSNTIYRCTQATILKL